MEGLECQQARRVRGLMFVLSPLQTGVIVLVSCQRYFAGGCYSRVVHVGEARSLPWQCCIASCGPSLKANK
jgi:hypothetical protein